MLIGRKVFHKTYGEGSIIGVTYDKYIIVAFSGSSKNIHIEKFGHIIFLNDVDCNMSHIQDNNKDQYIEFINEVLTLSNSQSAKLTKERKTGILPVMKTEENKYPSFIGIDDIYDNSSGDDNLPQEVIIDSNNISYKNFMNQLCRISNNKKILYGQFVELLLEICQYSYSNEAENELARRIDECFKILSLRNDKNCLFSDLYTLNKQVKNVVKKRKARSFTVVSKIIERYLDYIFCFYYTDDDYQKRNIVILKNEKYYNKAKNSYAKKLVALDILTGFVINIVNTNYGDFFSKGFIDPFIDAFETVKIFDVVNLYLKKINHQTMQNVYIYNGSPLHILGKCDLGRLCNKSGGDKNYYSSKMTSNFENCRSFLYKSLQSEHYMLVNFTDTKIMEHKIKKGIYQIKMQDIFVNFDSTYGRVNEGQHYIGLVLLKCYIDKNENRCYYGEPLFGGFKKTDANKNSKKRESNAIVDEVYDDDDQDNGFLNEYEKPESDNFFEMVGPIESYKIDVTDWDEYDNPIQDYLGQDEDEYFEGDNEDDMFNEFMQDSNENILNKLNKKVSLIQYETDDSFAINYDKIGSLSYCNTREPRDYSDRYYYYFNKNNDIEQMFYNSE